MLVLRIVSELAVVRAHKLYRLLYRGSNVEGSLTLLGAKESLVAPKRALVARVHHIILTDHGWLVLQLYHLGLRPQIDVARALILIAS